MELKKTHLHHVLVLTLGMAIGWVAQPWTEREPIKTTMANQLTSQSAKNKLVSHKQSSSLALDKLEITIPIENIDASFANTDDQQDEDNGIDANNWSGLQLLDYIGDLDEKDFWEKINSGEILVALEKSTHLFDEFMTMALDIQDRRLNRRLLYLFESVQTRFNNGQAATENPIEDWIMQRVDSENRSSEWLAYLSQIGVSTKSSYMSLTRRLRDYPNPEQTTSILSILARKPFMLGNSLNADEHALMEQVFEPYFNSQDNNHRMFAVASLSSLPFDQSKVRLQSAMEDESVRVRMSAMRIIRDNGFNTPQISASLVSSLSNTALSAYERLGAYEVLSRAKLSQEQYETVYQFAVNERVALEKEFRAIQKAAQKNNQ